ncbi:OLC1v1002078C1 [Oldenlandia corymbosa var. corymbosa]|nr:OLC1v1002078C1 [Oldenlandia corymbosa var. corymbosa]
MVTKELGNNCYLVYFKQDKKEKEFNSTQLRLHMEWKNGNWFTSQDHLEHSDRRKLAGPICIDVAGPEITVPFNNSNEKMALSLNLNEVDSSHSYEEFPRSSTFLKDKTQEDSFSALGGKGISKGEISIVNTANAETIESVDKMNLIECVGPYPETAGNLDGDRPEGHTWGKSCKRRRQKTSQDDAVGSEGGNGSSKKLHIISPLNPVRGMGGNALGDAAEVVKDGRIAVSTNLPVVLGLECDKGSNSTARKTYHPHSEEFLRHVGIRGGVIDNEPPRIKVRVLMNKMDPLEQDGDQLEAMRGRGRPLLGETKGPVTSPSGDSTKDASMDELLVKSFLTSCNSSLRDVEIKSASIDFSSQQFVINGGGKSKSNTPALPPFRNLGENSVDVPIMVEEKRSSKRGKRRTVSINAVSHAPVGKLDSPHTSAGKSTESNSTAEEMEIVSSELPAKPFEDQPLAKWIEEMHPPRDDDTSKVPPSRNVEQSAAASNGLPQIVEESGLPQIVEDSACQQATEESGQVQAMEESGQAQEMEESSQPQTMEESSQSRMMEERSQPQAREEVEESGYSQRMEEGRQLQAMEEMKERSSPQSMEESCQPEMEEESSQPQRIDGSCQLHVVEESLVVDKGTNVGEEVQALPLVNTCSDIGVSEVQPLPSLKNTCNSVGNEVQVLPFVKNNSLWSTLESMEVFKKFPQKPHFQPLEKYKESMREGLAIGYMVNFSSIVERTAKLQFDDSRSTIDDILDTLSELEGHGFNIQALQDRVGELVNMQGKEKMLREEFEQLNEEMEKEILEREEMNKQIMALQEKLSQITSAKESKDCKIASLQSKMEGIKENMTTMECDFERPLM